MNRDEMIHAYVDGELTQQEEQQVLQLLEQDAEARAQVEAYNKIREGIQATRLKEPDLSAWDDFETPAGATGWRRLGLGLIFVCYLALAGLAMQAFFLGDDSRLEKLLVGGLLIGFGILLLSLIYQRVIELKTDRYTRVEK